MASKKRKVDAENRQFNDNWSLKYFVRNHKGKPQCVICNNVIAVCKEFNIKRHYESTHSEYKDMNAAARQDKYNKLTDDLGRQQAMMTATLNQSKALIAASFEICQTLSSKGKPFMDGELIKECILIATKHVIPEKCKEMEAISLSRRTVTRRIVFVRYSLALDESTDASDIAQLAIFVRGVDKNFAVTEELASLCAMHDTTKGKSL